MNSPPIDTVNIMGFDVPVQQISFGEQIDLEELARTHAMDEDKVENRLDIALLAAQIFVRYRTNRTIKQSDLENTGASFEKRQEFIANVKRLLAPFFTTWANVKAQQMSQQVLEAKIAELEKRVEMLKGIARSS